MDFNGALSFVFGKEGGFSNDPTDHGGATNFGISSRANPDVDVASLTKDKAAQIYKDRYWDAVGCDTLPDNMKAIAFDTAVNCGVPTAKKMIEASGGDASAIVQQRADLYKNIIAKDPSQAKFANGWSNRLQAVAQTTQVDPLQASLAQLHQSGASDTALMNAVGQAGHGDEVQYALQQGFTPTEIVQKFGGAPLSESKARQTRIDSQGVGTNLLAGVKSGVQDLSTGAQQIGATITSDDAKLAQLNDDERARQADPDVQAQQNTLGSKIGSFGVKALPYAGAAVLTDGASIPAMIAAQGGAGALLGALTPTTSDGQRVGNILKEGAIGAGTAGAGALIGKGATALAGKILSGTPEQVAAAKALQAEAQAQGLPVNAATVSGKDGFWRNVAEGLPDNGSVQAFQAKADQAVAGKVAEGMGLPNYTGPINHDMLNTARPAIKQALDDATNVSVALPQSLATDVQGIVSGANNPLTKGIATNPTATQAAKNIGDAVQSGLPVEGRHLQDLASELKAVARNQTASNTERLQAGQMVGKINDALTSAMTPEQAAAFQSANTQYAHLKAVEKMVTASNDLGVVTPRQMLIAAKTGQFKNAFLQGEAPYQDLATTAGDLYGPASGKGLGAMLAKGSNALSDHASALTAIVHPHSIPLLLAKKAGSALMGKLATSENPTLVRLLSGQSGIDPTTAAYIAKALGNTGAVAGSQM